MVKEVFGPRYLVNDGQPAKNLKRLIDLGTSAERLKQLFFIHTARANLILFEFVTQVYWPHYNAGARQITSDDTLTFINNAHLIGRIKKAWSPAMKKKVSSYLLACLTDFGLARNATKGGKEVRPYNIQTMTTAYVVHEAHFTGIGDNGLLNLPDWNLFGLDRQGVLQELRKVADEGHFIIQFAGDLLRVSWKYKTMEECINGIAQR